MKTKGKSKDRKIHHRAGEVRELAESYAVAKTRVPDVLPYGSLEVANFRCFDSFKIESFNRINLITGTNNSGKTTLLEALFLHVGSKNPNLALIVDSWRGLGFVGESVKNQWRSLFWQFGDSRAIEIIGTSSAGAKRALQISVGSSGTALTRERFFLNGAESLSSLHQEITFKYVDEGGKEYIVKGKPVLIKTDNITRYELRIEPLLPMPMIGIFLSCHTGGNIGEEIERFSDLKKEGKDDLAVAAARIVEPRLQRLEILTYQGIPMIHGYIKGYDEPVPSPLLGDGTRRSLSLALAICKAKNGVVLVDEMENGIHHSALKSLWAVVAKAARMFNCQVFATTHSEECIHAAHEALTESGVYDLMVYRLDQRDGSVEAIQYDEEKLGAALSIPLEVRGWPEE